MKRLLRLLPFLLSGCMSSNFHPPAIPINKQWTVQNHSIGQSDEHNLPYIAWWQDFKDPTLNQLISAGISNNNTLNVSKGHVEAAEGELKKVRLQWIPDIDFLLGYSNNPATGFPGFLSLFTPSYTLNLFHQIKEQKRAGYELAATKAEDDAIKLTVISQIAASYFTYLAELEHHQLLQTLGNDLTKQAKIAERIHADGLSSDIEPQALYSQVNLIRGEQELVAQNIVVSSNALRYLINQNPGTIKTKQQFNELNNRHRIISALPMTVLENRPDLQMAEKQLRAANEGIGLAASILLPTVHLDLIMGPVAGNSQYKLPHTMVYFNDQIMKIPALKLSVLGDIAKARGLNKASYYNYLETLQRALRDTTNALSANERLSNKLAQTQKAKQRLAKAYYLNNLLYQKGIQSYLDTIKSKIALDKSNIDLNQDKLKQLITVVTLYQELAGGYKQDEATEEKNIGKLRQNKLIV